MTAMTKEIFDALKSAGAQDDLAKDAAVAVAEISASQREFHQDVSDQVHDVQSGITNLTNELKTTTTTLTADLKTTAAGLTADLQTTAAELTADLQTTAAELKTFVLTRLLLVALGQATLTAALVKLIQ